MGMGNNGHYGDWLPSLWELDGVAMEMGLLWGFAVVTYCGCCGNKGKLCTYTLWLYQICHKRSWVTCCAGPDTPGGPEMGFC